MSSINRSHIRHHAKRSPDKAALIMASSGESTSFSQLSSLYSFSSQTIYFEGGGTFSYDKDPERTRAAHTQAGWNTLGDLGYLDDEGYLYLSERRQDLIISGGMNIYPREAEDLLIEHPDVADVAVFGIPNEEYGEEVKACVQLVDPTTARDSMERALIEYCEHSLSRIKCPRSIDFLDELPRHPNGKLLKRELKERFS